MPKSRNRKDHKAKAASYSKKLKATKEKLIEKQRQLFMEQLEKAYASQKHEQELNTAPVIDASENIDTVSEETVQTPAVDTDIDL